MLDQFILQDSRSLTGTRISWWENGGGYTTDVSKAEVFSRAAALAQHESRETDLPWPLEFVLSRTQIAVDHQYIRPVRLVVRTWEDPCYVSVKCTHDGNDLVWVSSTGQTADLVRAAVFTRAQAAELFGSEGDRCSREIWPKTYIDAKARPIASSADMTVMQALLDTGITLAEPPRRRVRRPKCEACGRFVSACQARASSCIHCY